MSQHTTQPGTHPTTPVEPSPQPRIAVCPYCGCTTFSSNRCDQCRGLLDPLSRQASQNEMGPWFVRDEHSPFRPGCSLATLRLLVARGRIQAETVIRGPGTRQFWMPARLTPGVSHLFGECYSCHAVATAKDTRCASCGASIVIADDRQMLGLGDVRLVPGQAVPQPTNVETPLAALPPAIQPAPSPAPESDAVARRLRAQVRSLHGRIVILTCAVCLLTAGLTGVLLWPRLMSPRHSAVHPGTDPPATPAAPRTVPPPESAPNRPDVGNTPEPGTDAPASPDSGMKPPDSDGEQPKENAGADAGLRAEWERLRRAL
jgi:hypothetical protein